MLLKLLIVALFQTVLSVSYRNHTVIRVLPRLPEDVKAVQDLHEVRGKSFDLWSEPNLRSVDPILADISPQSRSEVLRSLNERGIKYDVVSNDLQKWIDEKGSGRLYAPESSVNAFNLEVYNSYERIVAYLVQLAAGNEGMRVVSIGKTFEGRDIQSVIVSEGNDVINGKPNVVLECGAHAREWVSPATCLWVISRLLTDDKDELSKYNFHIIPILNPDGYVYSWISDRKWRKNRALTSRSFCRGVDLNRNFDSHFGTIGVSYDPCDDSYLGTSPFSEKETEAIAKYLKKINGLQPIAAYFSLHSYAQKWMYPYGYTRGLPRNYMQLDILARQAVYAIKQTSGEIYDAGSIARILYPTSGTSVDWVYNELEVDVTFAVELRDKGVQGFLLDERLIRPTANELWQGLRKVLSGI